MPTAEPQPTAFRRLLLAGGVVFVLACGGWVLDRLFAGGLQAPFDFTEYWAAGRLNASGENPYDGSRVREVQRGLGLDDTAIMMWNPPWTLTLVMPVGVLPFRAAYGAWFLLHVGLLLASAELLWRGFGGEPGRRWVAYFVSLSFVPSIFLIGSGQITGVVLFGLAGFLAARRANRPFLAGMLGAITAVKPHLLALFALWLFLDAAVSRSGRRVVLGGLLVGLLACVPPTLANPEVWSQYAAATTGTSSADHHHLSRWTPPLAGWWLRQAVPGQPFWVQFLPVAVAGVGFGVWYGSGLRWERGRPARHSNDVQVTGADLVGRAGRPRSQEGALLPWVVGLSLLAAPYGVWQHDLVLLLVPVLAVAAKLAARPQPAAILAGVAWLVAANAAMLAMMLRSTSSEWYVWVTPVVLLGCLVADRLAARAPSLAPVPAGA